MSLRRYKQVELPNGGKLYYVKNLINNSTVVDINFDCGSRCNKIEGLAHFTEHMFFTGTDKMTKEDIAKKYFDFIDVNAATSLRYIYFNGQLFTKEFADYLSTVAMMITESTFSEENVEKEKQRSWTYSSLFQNLQQIYRNQDSVALMGGQTYQWNTTESPE